MTAASAASPPLLERPLGRVLEGRAVHVLVIALLALGWLFRDLERPLTADSVRYAAISKDMALGRAGWLAPTMLGEPYFRKPPLGFWIGAAFMKALGATSRAAMLPSTLAGLGLVLLLYTVVARVAGPLAGLLAAAVLTLTPDFYRNTATSRFDTLVLLFSALALVALERARERPAWFAGFWAFVGLGVLTKSGAGLVPLGLAVLAAVALRDPFPFHRGAFWAAGAIFVAVAGPWYAYMHARFGSGFWAVHIQQQALDRFGVEAAASGPRATGRLDFVRSCLFYLGPSAILAPAGAFLALRDRAAEPALRRAAAIGAIWVAAIFLVLQGLKPGMERERYMYFALFAAAGLGGFALAALARARLRPAHVALALAAGGLALLAVQRAFGDFERSRTSKLRALVHAANAVLPPGPVLAVVTSCERYANFAAFYFDRALEIVPPARAGEALAAREGEVLLLADEPGRAALEPFGPELVADGHILALLRVRPAGGRTAAPALEIGDRQ